VDYICGELTCRIPMVLMSLAKLHELLRLQPSLKLCSMTGRLRLARLAHSAWLA
jgi:hypothetical protein